jgi:TonB-linked SusC/RagA family outer membrane protein
LFFLLFSVLLCFQSSANNAEQSISLSEKNTPLADIFRKIERQSGYKFFYDNNLVKRANKVSIEIRNASLNDVLDRVLSDQPFTYTIVNNTIVIKEKQISAEVFTASLNRIVVANIVTGTVMDQTNSPLHGAVVQVKNKNINTTTDESGKFSISAEEGDDLVISFVGYQTVQMRVGKRTEINVSLTPKISSLNDVVVVGYGSQQKANLTGSVSTVKFDSEIENRSITNGSQALGGEVPGLWVSQNSGKPGDDVAQLRVRGWGTLNNTDPLVLIDGVEASMSDVNPHDIESVTVLKDAASSAIYGSRAANGVVLVTTKGGKFNRKAQVNFSTYYGQQSLGRRYNIIDNSAEFMTLWNQALRNQGGSDLYSQELIDAFKNGNDPYKYPNTNFFDYVFRKAPMTEQNLSVSGGTEKTNYYISLNYLNQEGIMRRSNSERYGLTLNLETKVKDWLTVGGRLNGIKRQSEEPYSVRDVMYWFANGGYPFIAPYTRDGHFGGPQAVDASGNPLVNNRNPLIFDAIGKNATISNYFKMNVYADVRFTEYLTFKTNFSSQYNTSAADAYNQYLTGYTDAGVETPEQGINPVLEASRTLNDRDYHVWFNTLNFNKKFGTRHDLSGVVGTQLESTRFSNTYAYKSDPPKEGLTQVSAGTSNVQAEGNKADLRMFSYFGRVNYALDGKYLFEMNFRADASSRFRKEKRWGYFPAFSAGWRLSEEQFIKNLNIFSNLKLRLSYGSLGNQNINSYWPYLTAITQNNSLSYTYGNKLAPGATSTALVDQDISWETTTTKDVGLDMGFLNDRLVIEADYFHRVTKGIIVQLPIPHVMGALDAPFENVGEMLNKGYEISATYRNIPTSRNGVGYTVGANLTYILNRVTKFRGGDAPDQLYLIREGYSYNTLYGYKALGVFSTDEEAAKYMFANGYVPHAGDLQYQDVNGDGKIGFEDKMGLGNTIPKYNLGLNLALTYKGFSLNVLAMGVTGINVYTQDAWTQPLGVSGGIITEKWRNAWTPTNTITDIPLMKINDPWNGEAYESSFWVHNISFLKLKNIQLGYQVPVEVTKRIGLQRLYFYINAQNVHSFVNKKYEGFDPERSTFDTGEFTYPTPRIISIGANVNF